ncbi:MAG: uracil-DNA glycosylase [Chromatiales bacterium]|nr:uracil-DNA glycosylase [Chromatiales bacterium]
MSDIPAADFDPDCRRCPRLAGFLDEVHEKHPDYFCRPVPSFGPLSARLLIVGLAPGMHGANASGRPFTGDYAGILLYQTLYEHGFANCPVSEHANDGLRLLDARITNAVRCLPPQNKPSGDEVKRCNPYLRAELDGLIPGSVVLALGLVAHRAVLSALGLKQAAYRFGHGAEHALPDSSTLLDSYHCSRYNTQTRRLTAAMFSDVFARARVLLDSSPSR